MGMPTVMVIDDDLAVLDNVKSALLKEKIAVIAVSDSRQALRFLNGPKEELFDLLLVNSLMPRSLKPALFSVKPSTDHETADTNGFLEKPFTSEQLLVFVKNRLG